MDNPTWQQFKIVTCYGTVLWWAASHVEAFIAVERGLGGPDAFKGRVVKDISPMTGSVTQKP